ncbi:MAG: ABC transporter substrate-binding protein, partial [Dehalococcoidia bacterium]|nr:ABC transporter substrate-binding protein [Dehalococcoidia bacterium]
MFKLRIVLAVMLASMILALACAPAAAPPAPTAVPTQATKAAPSAVPTSTTPPKPTSVPTPKTLEKVTLAVPSTTTLFIPYYLARDKGYFAEEGLDVDITTIAAAISIKALASGSAQQFDAAGGSAQSAIIAGLPIRIVEILTKNPPWWI